MKRMTWLAAGVVIAANATFSSVAQDTAAPDPTNARAKAATEAAELRAARLKANAEARAAMGLPSFNGQTTLGDNAGRLEAGLLSAEAVGSAAQAIVNALPKDGQGKLDANYVVLAADEAFDLGVLGAIRSQITALTLQLNAALAPPAPPPSQRRGQPFSVQMQDRGVPFGTTDAVGLATTILGALSSQTDVRGITEVGVTDELLARAVTAQLGTNAILPNAPRLSPQNSALAASFLALAGLRDRAELLRQSLEGNDAQKERLDRVKLALARYDAFFAFATTPDDGGVMPLARAIMLESIMGGTSPPHILRVNVDISGGSLTNTTNIGSYLGLDPIRISGGLVASYVATNASTGAVVKAGIFGCRTGLVRLRRVHDGTWRSRAPNRTARTGDCFDAAPAPTGG